MVDATIEQTLLDLERRYWQALKDKDVEAALELTDDPCIVTGAQGVGMIDHSHVQGDDGQRQVDARRFRDPR